MPAAQEPVHENHTQDWLQGAALETGSSRTQMQHTENRGKIGNDFYCKQRGMVKQQITRTDRYQISLLFSGSGGRDYGHAEGTEHTEDQKGCFFRDR